MTCTSPDDSPDHKYYYLGLATLICADNHVKNNVSACHPVRDLLPTY